MKSCGLVVLPVYSLAVGWLNQAVQPVVGSIVEPLAGGVP